VALLGIALSQENCHWYSWSADDWAVNQNFSQSNYALSHPHSYFDSNDFIKGGYFYGKKWEDVFFF